MKKSKKNAIIVAAAILFIGLVASFGAMFAMHFDFTGMNTVSFETKTYPVTDTFSHIAIEESSCDVRLYPSQGDTCKVVCPENDHIFYSVTVKDDTLHIARQDSRKWYEYIGVYWSTQEIGVYLPESSYNTLDANTHSGGIVMPEGFCFDSVNLQSDSGNIQLSALVNKKLSVKASSGTVSIDNAVADTLIAQTDSGQIKIDHTNAQTELQAKAISGDILLSDVQSSTISSTVQSGKIAFTKVFADESIRMESISGDITLQKSDAGALWIKTTGGRVSGTLLTEKVFLTDTVSGRVDVPRSASGGKCEISTVSGDIHFD